MMQQEKPVISAWDGSFSFNSKSANSTPPLHQPSAIRYPIPRFSPQPLKMQVSNPYLLLLPPFHPSHPPLTHRSPSPPQLPPVFSSSFDHCPSVASSSANQNQPPSTTHQTPSPDPPITNRLSPQVLHRAALCSPPLSPPRAAWGNPARPFSYPSVKAGRRRDPVT